MVADEEEADVAIKVVAEGAAVGDNSGVQYGEMMIVRSLD